MPTTRMFIDKVEGVPEIVSELMDLLDENPHDID